jgi:predicted TIM-barrel fold metal-dependent hydrolase
VIIDIHAHWIPKAHFLGMEKYIAPGERVEAYEATPGVKWRRVIRDGIQVFAIPERFYRLDEQIKDMDEAGVDLAVLNTDTWQTWISMDTCQFINDELARSIEPYAERFIALAHVPPIEEAIGELDRAVKDLGFKGVSLTGHYRGAYLDEDICKPFLKKVSELDVPIVIHPNATPVEYRTLLKTPMFMMRVIDGGIATARVLFNVLRDFPKLKFVMPHCGGAFTMFMTAGVGRVPPENLKRLYVDTAPGTRSSGMIEACIEAYGAGQVLFGTDYPSAYDWLKAGVSTIQKLNIDEETRQKLFSENAARLMKIKS